MGIAMQEYVVLVNDENEVLGTASKADVHTDNTPLHRGFSLFLFDKNGKLLLQQRSSGKKTWPLVWSNSVCGHPVLEETAVEAAKRRLSDELGIRTEAVYEVLPDYRYRVSKDGVEENELCPVLIGFFDGEPVPNPDEVEAVRWIEWGTFLAEVKDGSAEYSPWCVEEAVLLDAHPLFRNMCERIYGGFDIAENGKS